MSMNCLIKMTVLVALAAGPAPAKGPADGAEATLSGLGLARSRSVLVLGGESETRRRLAGVNSTFEEHQGIVAQMQAIVENDAALVALGRARLYAGDRERAAKIYHDSLPAKGNNQIVANKQAAYNEWLAARDSLRVVDLEIGERRQANVPGPQRQGLVRSAEKLEATFREDVAALRQQADSVVAEYKRLGALPEVQAALRSFEAAGEKVKLGPTDKFRADLQGIVKAEREVKKADKIRAALKKAAR